MHAPDPTSTRPYLIRALYEWCTDNGYTPFLAVQVDETVRVPQEFVNNGEIVLNIGFDATGGLKLGNDYIEFKARFGGVAREIFVPVDRVAAIYARENGQGMAFAVTARTETPQAQQSVEPADGTMQDAATGAPARVVQLVTNEAPAGAAPSDPQVPPKPPSGSRPSLKRIK